MSRAVLRKRKRQAKKDGASPLVASTSSSSWFVGVTPREKSEDFSDAEEDTDKGANPLSTMTAGIGALDNFDILEVDVSQLTMIDIANASDGFDATSAQKAELLLRKILSPTSSQAFFETNWEKSPIFCDRRGDRLNFDKLFSRNKFNRLIGKHVLFEGVNVCFQRPHQLDTKKGVGNVVAGYDSDDDDKNDAGGGGKEASAAPVDEEAREVNSAEVMARYEAGETVKLLTPQLYNDNIWCVLSSLEYLFNCRVGAEIVLVPPPSTNSTGSWSTSGGGKTNSNTTSHTTTSSNNTANAMTTITKQPQSNFRSNNVDYDCCNAFILQLEGASRWRVAANPSLELVLAQTAGALSLKEEAVAEAWRAPLLDVVLQPGDSLYIPKGWLFQQTNQSTEARNDTTTSTAASGNASSCSSSSSSSASKSTKPNKNSKISSRESGNGEEGQHSLHMKIYTHEGSAHTMGELLQLAVPQALAEATQGPPPSAASLLRAALPLPCLQMFGVAASENDECDPRRKLLRNHIAQLMDVVTTQTLAIIDPACDQMKKQFIAERLPVPLQAHEEACSAAGAPLATIYPYTQLRMLRPGIAVAVVEDGKIVVYHCMDNSRELFGAPLQPLEFDLDDGPTIEMLLMAYPDPVVVSELDHPSEELDDKLGVAQALYKEGILMIADEASNPSSEPLHHSQKRSNLFEQSAAAATLLTQTASAAESSSLIPSSIAAPVVGAQPIPVAAASLSSSTSGKKSKKSKQRITIQESDVDYPF